MIKSEIRVPLLNANEPEARLVEVHVEDRQAVEKGTPLFTIETTKAASEIESPESGFIRLLTVEGATLAVGELLAVITDTAEERVEVGDGQGEQVQGTGDKSPGTMSLNSGEALRMTRPARALIETLGLDITAMPADRLITEDVVRQYAGRPSDIGLPSSEKPYILIYGGGGHAKSILEIVLQNGNHAVAGIVDDDPKMTGIRIMEIPVLGTRAILTMLHEKGVKLAANGVGGILDINIRVRLFELLENAGFIFPSLIHPRATVEPSSKVEEGSQVFANAYVGADARLHSRCMINTNAVVSHDCEIGRYSHIAPGALLAGHVHVGERSLVGMGVTTAIGVRIGDGVRIGNGAILLSDVPDRTIIQAGRFWTGKQG
jgi:sugar O-acyltransferase (sialic acid O-acetyltransferase NeuD family)